MTWCFITPGRFYVPVLSPWLLRGCSRARVLLLAGCGPARCPWDPEHRLTARPAGQPALETLRQWMIETINDITSSRADRASHYWHARAMRARLINENDRLRGMARASYTPAERILAAAIADDLHVEPDTLAPRLAAVSAVTGLRELYDSREARSLGPEPTAGDLSLLLNQVIDYTIAGLAAVHADASAVEAR